MMEGEINTKVDISTEEAGSFWCHACLDDKPVIEQSFDPRYCHGCCDFLLNEAKLLPPTKRPAWIPKPQNNEKPVRNLYQVPVVGDGNMSTVGSEKSEVDIISPPWAYRTLGKRGPKQKDLPQEIIEGWAGEGTGSKAIASRLNRELHIKVSYKTIQRLLSGKRRLVTA